MAGIGLASWRGDRLSEMGALSEQKTREYLDSADTRKLADLLERDKLAVAMGEDVRNARHKLANLGAKTAISQAEIQANLQQDRETVGPLLKEATRSPKAVQKLLNVAYPDRNYKVISHTKDGTKLKNVQIQALDEQGNPVGSPVTESIDNIVRTGETLMQSPMTLGQRQRNTDLAAAKQKAELQMKQVDAAIAEAKANNDHARARQLEAYKAEINAHKAKLDAALEQETATIKQQLEIEARKANSIQDMTPESFFQSALNQRGIEVIEPGEHDMFQSGGYFTRGDQGKLVPVSGKAVADIRKGAYKAFDTAQKYNANLKKNDRPVTSYANALNVMGQEELKRTMDDLGNSHGTTTSTSAGIVKRGVPETLGMTAREITDSLNTMSQPGYFMGKAEGLAQDWLVDPVRRAYETYQNYNPNR